MRIGHPGLTTEHLETVLLAGEALVVAVAAEVVEAAETEPAEARAAERIPENSVEPRVAVVPAGSTGWPAAGHHTRLAAGMGHCSDDTRRPDIPSFHCKGACRLRGLDLFRGRRTDVQESKIRSERILLHASDGPRYA